MPRATAESLKECSAERSDNAPAMFWEGPALDSIREGADHVASFGATPGDLGTLAAWTRYP
eukprot:8220378-Alexandrium_andersonii.AAC.2